MFYPPIHMCNWGMFLRQIVAQHTFIPGENKTNVCSADIAQTYRRAKKESVMIYTCTC